MTASGRALVTATLLVLGALTVLLSTRLRDSVPVPAPPKTLDAALARLEPGASKPLPTVVPEARGEIAAEVRRGLDLRSALSGLRQRLAADDPLLLSLVDEVRVACALIKRPDAAFALVEDDPNRLPWRAALAARCSGVDAVDLAEANWPQATWTAWEARMPSAIVRTQGVDAGVAAARRAIASSAETRVLADALRALINADALPLREVFDASDVPTPIDLEGIALTAADWIACARAAACGNDGLATLNLCTQFGCPPGTDLQRALLRTLPRAHYEAARRLVLWALRSP